MIPNVCLIQAIRPTEERVREAARRIQSVIHRYLVHLQLPLYRLRIQLQVPPKHRHLSLRRNQAVNLLYSRVQNRLLSPHHSQALNRVAFLLQSRLLILLHNHQLCRLNRLLLRSPVLLQYLASHHTL